MPLLLRDEALLEKQLPSPRSPRMLASRSRLWLLAGALVFTYTIFSLTSSGRPQDLSQALRKGFGSESSLSQQEPHDPLASGATQFRPEHGGDESVSTDKTSPDASTPDYTFDHDSDPNHKTSPKKPSSNKSSPDRISSSGPPTSNTKQLRPSWKPQFSTEVVQVSMLAGDANSALYDRMLHTHLQYGEKWGYRTEVLNHYLRGTGDWKASIFSKPLYILQVLMAEMVKPDEQRAQWVVWFDSDTILLNPNIPWTMFLPPEDFDDIHMLGTRDWTGFNNGVFMLRVHEWSVDLLTETVATPLEHPEIDLGHKLDQEAIRRALQRNENQNHVLFQPMSWYNGQHYESETNRIRKVHPGDFLVHFVGWKDQPGGKANLTDAVETWFNRTAKADASTWAVPLNGTSYRKEVNDYWETLRQARNRMKHAEKVLEMEDKKAKDHSGDDEYESQRTDVRASMKAMHALIQHEAFESEKVLEAEGRLNGTLEPFPEPPSPSQSSLAGSNATATFDETAETGDAQQQDGDLAEEEPSSYGEDYKPEEDRWSDEDGQGDSKEADSYSRDEQVEGEDRRGDAESDSHRWDDRPTVEEGVGFEEHIESQ